MKLIACSYFRLNTNIAFESWPIYYSMYCYGFYLIRTDLHDPVLVTLWPRSGHNFERHHNNLSSVNYLMTTVTWNLSLKFIEVRIFCYIMPVIGKNMISWFYAYVEHIEIKTKTVNIIHFSYLDLSQNVKIRDVPCL
jgi:hypothetical protein